MTITHYLTFSKKYEGAVLAPVSDSSRNTLQSLTLSLISVEDNENKTNMKCGAFIFHDYLRRINLFP
jgi:hypothetical protein